MFGTIRNIAEAVIEVAALRDERIRLCKEAISKTDLTFHIAQLTKIRNQYLNIIEIMLSDQLAKSFYTEKDRELGKFCINEIARCDEELSNCGQKIVKEAILSKLEEILFH